MIVYRFFYKLFRLEHEGIYDVLEEIKKYYLVTTFFTRSIIITKIYVVKLFQTSKKMKNVISISIRLAKKGVPLGR